LLRRSKIDEADEGEVAAADAPSSVLVVNDDHDSCELIARLVESSGWRAQRCYDTDDAEKTLDRPMASFTAVVVDLSTGLEGGLPVLAAARRQPHPRGAVPVLVLSSRSDDETVAWQGGADSVMIRPFHASELLDELQTELRRSDAEREASRATKASAAS
jgi:DNA-binding response OmpR family regulator